jgi:hypothetical protein
MCSVPAHWPLHRKSVTSNAYCLTRGSLIEVAVTALKFDEEAAQVCHE